MSLVAGGSICVCYQVDEDQIVGWIRQGAVSIEDLGERCLAGQGCGDCHELLAELLEDFGPEAGSDER